MGRYCRSLMVSIVLIFGTFNLIAQEQPIEALSNLTFDELLDLEISVATISPRNIYDVPSSVTVFTRTQIHALGMQNLYELLNLVPGFQVTRGDWVGAVPKEHARGVYLDNGYILFLVDGQRINELSFGKAAVYMPFMALDIVDRVEIIRGPGSAIYGSNAFMGVVNVITRKNENWVTLGLGENSATKLNAGFTHASDELNVNLLLDLRRSDGNTYTEASGNRYSDPFEHDLIQLSASYKDFALTWRWNESLLEDFINLGGIHPHNSHRSSNEALNLRYQTALSDNSELKLNVHYVEHEIESAGKVLDAASVDFITDDFLTGPFWVTDDLEISLDYALALGKQAVLNLGLMYRSAEQTQAGTVTNYLDPDTDELTLSPEYYLGIPFSFAAQGVNARSPLLSTQETRSVYIQYNQFLSEDLEFYVGARYDDVKHIDSNISPRIALNYRLNGANQLKLHYGEAFRTPVTNELFSEDLVTVGNPNLKPEEIKTLELLWQYQSERDRFEVVLFNNDLDAFVNKVPLSNSLTQFTFDNSIEKTIKGLEFSVRSRIGDGGEWFLNYTQIFDDPINASYKRFGNIGIRWRWQDIQLNLDTIWRDSLSVESDFNFGSYMLWNARLNYFVAKNWQLSLSASNLTDKQYVVYEPRLSNAAMPGYGRESWITAAYAF